MARSTLLVDSAPTKDTVTRYATHLLAEMEQTAYGERKVKASNPKIKTVIEDGKGAGKGQSSGGKPREVKKDDVEVTQPERRCRFFNSDAGCRKGKACKWSHIPDDRRRCYTCGSTARYSSSCPTTSSSELPRAKVVREETEASSRTETAEAPAAVPGDGEKQKAERSDEEPHRGSYADAEEPEPTAGTGLLAEAVLGQLATAVG